MPQDDSTARTGRTTGAARHWALIPLALIVLIAVVSLSGGAGWRFAGLSLVLLGVALGLWINIGGTRRRAFVGMDEFHNTTASGRTDKRGFRITQGVCALLLALALIGGVRQAFEARRAQAEGAEAAGAAALRDAVAGQVLRGEQAEAAQLLAVQDEIVAFFGRVQAEAARPGLAPDRIRALGAMEARARDLARDLCAYVASPDCLRDIPGLVPVAEADRPAERARLLAEAEAIRDLP